MIPQAIVIVTAALTLRSDDKPIRITVNKPRGTLYWGGAGLDGGYVQPQLDAFAKAGIRHCYVGKTNSATKFVSGDLGTLIDAARAGIGVRYEDDGEWELVGMNNPSGQFNLVGYSYGSLLAAQTANFYARHGHIVDHLVLVGSPIDADFLKSLRANRNIKKVVVINLTEYGDPIYAGISQSELISATATLASQMSNNKAEGHFYFAHVVADSPRRWAALARRLYEEGLR